MKTCKTCKSWKRNKRGMLGICCHLKVGYLEETPTIDFFLDYDVACPLLLNYNKRVWVETGGNFGCIHHESKKKANEKTWPKSIKKSKLKKHRGIVAITVGDY
jgi:hypothetical protein